MNCQHKPWCEREICLLRWESEWENSNLPSCTCERRSGKERRDQPERSEAIDASRARQEGFNEGMKACPQCGAPMGYVSLTCSLCIDDPQPERSEGEEVRIGYGSDARLLDFVYAVFGEDTDPEDLPGKDLYENADLALDKLRAHPPDSEPFVRAREPVRGTHLRADGKWCDYIYGDNGACNKCGFVAKRPPDPEAERTGGGE